MEPHEIREGACYTGGGELRKVVAIERGRAHHKDRGPGVEIVRYQLRGDGHLQTIGLRAFARWAEAEVGRRQAAATQAIPATPQGKAQGSAVRQVMPRGVARLARSAATRLHREGMPDHQLAAFVAGMFATRYGFERSIAWAHWLRAAVGNLVRASSSRPSPRALAARRGGRR